MCFANIRNGKIIDLNSIYLDSDITRVEVSEDIYNAYLENRNKIIYENEEVIRNPNFEIEQAQQERERLNMLSLTAADVERAVYKAKGMDFEDIIERVRTLKQVQGASLEIDLKALKIELKSNNFYRGNPLINQIGKLLEFSESDLDYLFEYKEFPESKTEEAESA